MSDQLNSSGRVVRVCQGPGCETGKSPQIREALEQAVVVLGLKDVSVDFGGCHGFCQQGPLVEIGPEGFLYTQVRIEDVEEIARSHLKDNKPVERLFYQDPQTGKQLALVRDIPFYARQKRVVLRNCGHINPERIEDYLAVGGYQALKKALTTMTPEGVIAEVKKAGLRGRGGAGFPTGVKWELCRQSPGNEKYVICNADEGDPGAFMDRAILEGDPHAVLEGLIIAGYAIGAQNGFIYVRAEYPLAVKRFRIAMETARRGGFLGKNIFGSSFNFEMHLREGAGAFVCGEETALMASIEGKRGMPRSRPPFPAQSGLWRQPSNINNVKTLANVPIVIGRGAEAFAATGTEKSKGTAIFALTGKVANCGLVEVPMGTPLSEIVYEIGGGPTNGKRLKAVQTGGPSGGCIPSHLVETPVDYESLAALGAIMGSGGMVVMDEDDCMVDVARYFSAFTQDESCGKCVMCRLGTLQMLGLLQDITAGRAKPEDLDLLSDLAQTVKIGSLCGLGQTAPNPILTTIKYFKHEYEEHIKRHHCAAAVCKGLVIAPCRHTCPSGINVPKYIRFIQAGKHPEAVATIREKIPFPFVCGLVCFHPCEKKCRRGQVDESVAIRILKGFAAARDTGAWREHAKSAPATGKKVAVIGAGPAGLTTAYYLARKGHQATILEALPEAGGMMRYGIPEYRLPRATLAQEIEEISKAGVQIRTGVRVESLDKLFEEGYHAVFVGAGAHKGQKLGVTGEEARGVIEGVDFLRELNLGKAIKVGDRVGIIGGGNVAIDAARTALRLGAKDVSIIYRRTRAEMPASEEEVEEALAEGVKLQYLAAPLKISVNGNVRLECLKMGLGKRDASGRPRPEPIKGSEFTLDLDTVIAAIGQTSDIPAAFGLKLNKNGTIEVNSDTMETSRKGVFAGGDAVLGPASVIQAIAQGRDAASAIDRFLGGDGVIDEVLSPEETDLRPIDAQEEEKRRPAMALKPAAARTRSFEQVEQGYTIEQAIEEAKRCLRCDLEK
ncbi:MAG: FAD-dependent oxidoreductase [Chloroflexi bacterium]|nr:FAD-dependent oxidoreductase [Chloroflexota bacterium]